MGCSRKLRVLNGAYTWTSESSIIALAAQLPSGGFFS